MFWRLLLAVELSVGLTSPALAEPAMTGAPVVMRIAPTGKAAIVQRIPNSAEIDVLKCARGWCDTWWRGRFGYIPADAVVLGPPRATLPSDALPPPVAYTLPTYVTPPVWRWDGAYVGANWGWGSGHW